MRPARDDGLAGYATLAERCDNGDVVIHYSHGAPLIFKSAPAEFELCPHCGIMVKPEVRVRAGVLQSRCSKCGVNTVKAS